MFSLFRKIRQRLLANNRIRKYLLYAIGEIILVVIGILIALQINNWNESRKKEKAEIQYLQRLKIDLAQDTLYFNQRIKTAKNAIQNNTKAIRMAYLTQHNLEELKKLLDLHSYFTEPLIIQDDTYRELTSSGNLNIFRDDSLKIAIIRFYQESEQAEKRVQEYNNLSVRRLDDLVSNIILWKYYGRPAGIFNDEYMFYDADWSFINDPTSHKFRSLEDCLSIYIRKYQTLLPYFADLKLKSIALMGLIDKELEKRE